MVCPVCNTKLEKNAKECALCGYRLDQEEGHSQNSMKGSRRICPVCGAGMRSGDTVCPLCGVLVRELPEADISEEFYGEALGGKEAVESETSAGAKEPVESGASAEAREPVGPGASAGVEEPVEQGMSVASRGAAEQGAPMGQQASVKKKRSARIKVISVIAIDVIFLLLAGGAFFFVMKDRIVGISGNVTPTEQGAKKGQQGAEQGQLEAEEESEPTVEEEPASVVKEEPKPAAVEKPAPIGTEEPKAKPEEEATAKKDTEPAEDKENKVRIEDYCGYWYISGDPERELEIKKLTDDTVLFTLLYYRLCNISDVEAHLEGDTAHFSDFQNGRTVEGSLVFKEGYIVVQIAQSELVYMPAETMVYEVRYDDSPMKNYDANLASIEGQYLFRIVAPPVYIYGGPGYEYGIVGMITDDNEYTIVEESETDAGGVACFWGKLLSGAGWINLDTAMAIGATGSPMYILPDSATTQLTFDHIKELSPEQLRLARNEIYARHGRKFEDEGIRAYFESQWWYKGVIEAGDFSDDMLSDLERSNAEFIMAYE